MSDSKEKLISLNEASRMSPYTANYLGLLIRKGKLKGYKNGLKWCTTETDLKDYLSRVAEASYQHQENLNVKIPAQENKKALTNLKWSLIIIILFIIGAIIIWRIEKQIGSNDIYVEKNGKDLIIHVDDPNSIGAVTVVPKE
jgi:hypothetical protein